MQTESDVKDIVVISSQSVIMINEHVEWTNKANVPDILKDKSGLIRPSIDIEDTTTSTC